jgi:putative sterol carrier protein
VPEFPSAEWFAARTGAGGSPGPSLTLQIQAGDVPATVRLREGVVVEAVLGTTADADVSVTASAADAGAIAAGELDPSVAFMQGRMKTAGDPGLLLDLLAHVARSVRRAEDPGASASR